MNRLLIAITLSVLLCGCYPLTKKDIFAEAAACSTLSKDRYKIILDGGKISWILELNNKSNKRCYSCGTITVFTVGGPNIFIDFGTSVEAATRDNPAGKVNVGEKDIEIDGIDKSLKMLDSSCVLIDGAGCETPTTHQAGNWPTTPLWAKYSVEAVSISKELPAEQSCSIENVVAKEANGKLVMVSFTLASAAKTETIYRGEIICTTDDGRTDTVAFAYSLRPGEHKDISRSLGFDKQFKKVETKIKVGGTVKTAGR